MNYEKNTKKREREQRNVSEWKRRKEEMSIVGKLVRAISSHFWCFRMADWISEYYCLDFMAYPLERSNESPETIRIADPTFLRRAFYLT